MIIDEILSTISMKAPTLLLAIGIFILFWVGGIIFKSIVQRIMNEKSLHANISAIVAGLGLTGFAFGFAFKDMLSNFISGALIFIYEPFKLGDTIEVEGKTGKVIDINFRYVTIEAKDQKVLVPNSISVSKVISVKK